MMNKIDAELLTRLGQMAEQMPSRLFIDAGVGHLRLRMLAADGCELENHVLPSNRNLADLVAEYRIAERFGTGDEAQVFITGKLAHMVRQALGGGRVFLHAAVLWLAAQQRVRAEQLRSLALIEISASGYLLVGVDGAGRLRDDLLIQNPRCGAGTGVNIDRVLQKLGIARDEVDTLLADYQGAAGRAQRQKITTRADRCGVFGASATISDKNQGIPLTVALATTLKSEVLKVCRKLPKTEEGYERALLTGRFFSWRFVRDCAEDALHALGVAHVDYDTENDWALDALHDLISQTGLEALAQPDWRLLRERPAETYPDFARLQRTLTQAHLYHRVPTPAMHVPPATCLLHDDPTPVHIGLDVGSTMAKAVMTDDEGEILYLDACSNAGDTIETVKRIFTELQAQGIQGLKVRSVGITGSARYQVREALSRLYPHLAARIAVLVENYAHARGSIDQARMHIERLKAQGITDINEDFCVLVDIGGEDTKISTLALQEAELFNNAMNVKCSAGTGSLMDTLSALFGIPGAGQASSAAMTARQGHVINATCAVFLMENAQKLQAQGVPREEILASANWAIVENMARTLWSQVDLPGRAVVLLHGQTMLSDPLPLAVTQRLQSYLGTASYGLVPPYPGHRACLGLIRSLRRSAPEGAGEMPFATFLDARFDKRIIQCQGAACDDPEAVCNRTSLKCQGSDGGKFTFTLGGCTAINELFARAAAKKEARKVAVPVIAATAAAPVSSGDTNSAQPRDTYKEIWDAVDARNPKSDDANRLVIPRSFVVSDWAGFLAQIFVGLGVPVHVDNVIEADLTAAQPAFDIDSCAPHMGAVGQFKRLAAQPHGMILAAQIEKVPTGNISMGRTCTLNQGGIAVAANLAQAAQPQARVHQFALDLSVLDATILCDQIFQSLQPVFAHYGLRPERRQFVDVITAALRWRQETRAAIADFAADRMEEALAQGFKVALVVGREYLLNPGIYDSHVRRLLRDKQMAAIPSYVFDIALDPQFSHIYWRNPHLINTMLAATAQKKLHERILQPRLAKIIEGIESGEELLTVVQVSTFCCGPDSVTLPLSAELMKKRPFLLIQSDAIIKELAHLENRVNTYVRQLETGLHAKLAANDEPAFEVRTLDQLENQQPISREEDVIYFPTMSDNRVLTSVLRAAGFSCVDNYDEFGDLQTLIKSGRKSVGDAVCAPMAGVYGDLERAQADFARRKAAGEAGFVGKKRLLFFDNAGSGPCRQGQYVEMHKLAQYKNGQRQEAGVDDPNCTNAAGGAVRFLVAREAEGYNFGIEEWTLLRMYQGSILQGVLHDLLFAAGSTCHDYEEYQHMQDDFLKLKEALYAKLESFRGPGRAGRAAVAAFGAPAKLWAYRLTGSDLAPLLRTFSRRWAQRPLPDSALHIHVTGEVYMRVAQAEEIFRTLVAQLGFRRFRLEVAPVWSYLEYLTEEFAGDAQEEMALIVARCAREGRDAGEDAAWQAASAKQRRIRSMRWMLRHLLARPLYRAAGLPLPLSAAATMTTAREVLPTMRPIGELGPYIGEVLHGLRAGGDLFINVAPSGCMVSAMGQVISPRLKQVVPEAEGRIQHLFSGDGEVNDELLAMAALKAFGPERFFLQPGAPRLNHSAAAKLC